MLAACFCSCAAVLIVREGCLVVLQRRLVCSGLTAALQSAISLIAAQHCGRCLTLARLAGFGVITSDVLPAATGQLGSVSMPVARQQGTAGSCETAALGTSVA